MQPTVIDADTQEFNGLIYTRANHRYYRKFNAFLHRDVYQYTYGNIPHGWVVHHIDGDRLNNDIANLKAMSAREHSRLHNKGHTRRPVAGLAALVEWRKTDEAQAFMRAHGKTVVHHMKVSRAYKCEQCGIDFVRSHGGKNRFCSGRCKNRHREASGIDLVVRTCPVCGKDWTINKHLKTVTCSRKCSWGLRPRKASDV